MTVNTLGSDSRIGGGSVATSKSPESRTVAEWLWPLLVGGAALFAISALVYYNIHPKLEVTSFLQHTIAKIYNWFGFAPSVVFFLMVFAWSSIWAVTGILERPLARFGRLLIMALMVGVFLNLGSGGVSSGAHTGAIGAWIASRLVVGIGYVFSIVLVGPAMFASLMLATDWFFSEWFERDRKTTNFETGVEVGVTDHLRSLSEVANRPVAEPATASAASTASSVDVTVDDEVAAEPSGDEEASGDEGIDQAEIAAQLARVAAAAIEEPTVVLEPAEAAPETAAAEAVPASEAGSDEDAADDHVIVPARPLSYAERRRQRAERRVREEEPEPAPVSSNPVSSNPVASNTDSEAVDDTPAPAGSGAVMVTEEELESLFDADGADAEVVAEESAVEESVVDEVAEEAPVAEASVADVDETEDAEAAEEVDGEEELEEEEEVDEDELEEDEEEVDEEEVDEDELEDDEEEVDEDELEEDEEEVDEGELDEDEEELEDEEEVDEEDDEEVDEEVDEDELDEEDYESEEDDEEVDEDELEDEEGEDEDGEEEEEELEDDVESAELEEEEEEEIFVTDDDVEVDEEHVIDEAVEATLVDDLAASVAGAEQQYTEPEEIVSIPRPEDAPAVSLPTPPEVREREGAPASRQQKLFSSEIDEDLMEEAVDLVNSGRRTTATLLQRKLRIDYELAVEVLSELTTRGLVSGDDDRS